MVGADALLFPVSAKIPGGTERRTADMMRADLLAAKRRWIDEADTPVERRRRKRSDFLEYEDDNNRFAGCIPGVHEVLRRQGLLAGTWCLDPQEQLSPGQSEELDRIYRMYPHLTDDEFVAEHLDEWLQ